MSEFINRTEAAKELAKALRQFKGNETVVLAIPRGGVPMGAIVARALDAKLDLLLIKKLGHPLSGELAIGAIGMHERLITNRREVSEQYIESETRRLREELKEQYRMFQGDRTPADVKGKTAIIIDDGIATGSTMLAAIEILRKREPAEIIVAVPVAPPDSCREIEKKVDELICLVQPEYFQGVGQFYREFSQVTNEEVVELLKGFA